MVSRYDTLWPIALKGYFTFMIDTICQILTTTGDACTLYILLSIKYTYNKSVTDRLSLHGRYLKETIIGGLINNNK